MTNTRFVALSIATVTSPAASNGSLSSMSHLAGIGLLIAERDSDHCWHFDLESCWRRADSVLPPLLDAAGEGDAEIGLAFLDRLAKLVTGLSVDLAVPHGGAGAPAFNDIAAIRGIAVGTMTAAAIESVWSFGETVGVREHVEADALALWQLWLLEGNGRAAAASEAFAAWLNQRSSPVR